MKTIILTGVFFSLSVLVFGQDTIKYKALISKAEELYDKKQFLKSAHSYSEAFSLPNVQDKLDDRYNAACSWALANQIDSSFKQLFIITTTLNYSEYNHLVIDPDLESLYKDSRWEEIKTLTRKNKDELEKGLNKQLIVILDTIAQEDQKYRMRLSDENPDSKEANKLWDLADVADSINLVKVKNILDQYGWVGPDMIGEEGSFTLFLVIQHADSATQAQYLPMMRDAVKKGNAKPKRLALLEDRILLDQGKKQIYGSQLFFNKKTKKIELFPLEDPDNVDKRRAEVGLPPLAEYIRQWGLTWDVEKYKASVKESEEKTPANKQAKKSGGE